MNKNILLCGIGGQGTVLASKLIASAAMRGGEIVHSAETIGMAQRGGSVTSHVRIGEAYAPMIPFGTADIIIAFEPAEAVRNLPYLKPDGVVIVNKIPVKPVTESLQPSGYDGAEMIAYLQKKCKTVIVADAAELTAQVGNSKCLNIILLGIAYGTGTTGLTEENILLEIEERVAPRFQELNKTAFLLGKQIGAKYAIN